jgi:hypothetical protein
LAKKWQDVEFVDYKERQRRRRMKRRQQVAEEVTAEVTNRWNMTLVGTFAAVFIVVISALSYFLFAAQEKKEDADSKRFVQLAELDGSSFSRLDAAEDWSVVGRGEQLELPMQVKAGDDSRAEFSTFDNVRIFLMNGAEALIESIEIFGGNQASKSNVKLFSGEHMFDSRRSAGLVKADLDSFGEAEAERPKIYAKPSLFKVAVSEDVITIKQSIGALSVEYGSQKVFLGTGEMVSIKPGELGEKEKFNPLKEEW